MIKTVHIDVNKATLTATANNRSRAYGANNPTLPVTLSGFVNGETSTVVDTAPTATCAAVASDPAGTTTAIVPANGADNNYDFNYVNGTLTINKATLTAKADNQTRQYGAAEPDFTISYTGFVNGDTPANITPPTGSTDALITSSVGNYTITLAGGSAANYNFSRQTGALAIIKAPLFVITDDQTKFTALRIRPLPYDISASRTATRRQALPSR